MDKLIYKEKTTRENRIWVRISAACNNICMFCLDDEAQNGKFIPKDVVEEQISSWFKPGLYNRIIISWGEASINPKFSHYIEYAKGLWYQRIQTVTNGNMFSSSTFCDKVFSAWLQEVTFSFHGHNPKLHDYLVWVPGAFKKSLNGLIYIKKYYPDIIVNIDIVVNKVNIVFLPEIVRFFMRFWVYEYDILQIVPFWRWFSKYKNTLFYNISEYKNVLHETWKLSKIPWMCMWTNRFHVEAFEWYEDLIQDPRKVKSEVMSEASHMFSPFIESQGKLKPECFWERCQYCFIQQYCHNFLDQLHKPVFIPKDYKIIRWCEFPSQVYEIYGDTLKNFKETLASFSSPLINIPHCLWGSGVFETYANMDPTYTLWDYTQKYINNLYRKKSLRCKTCIHNASCQGIHINFIRSYGFDILQPIPVNIWE